MQDAVNRSEKSCTQTNEALITNTTFKYVDL